MHGLKQFCNKSTASKDEEVLDGSEFVEAVKKHINPNFSEGKKDYSINNR